MATQMRISQGQGGAPSKNPAPAPSTGGRPLRCNVCQKGHRVCDFVRPTCGLCARLNKECSYSNADLTNARAAAKKAIRDATPTGEVRATAAPASARRGLPRLSASASARASASPSVAAPVSAPIPAPATAPAVPALPTRSFVQESVEQVQAQMRAMEISDDNPESEFFNDAMHFADTD